MEKKENTQGKKTYETPRMLASSVRSAAQSVCGWYTQCGKDVKSRS